MRKYIAVSAIVIAIIFVAYALLNQPIGNGNGEEEGEGKIISEDIGWVTGNVTITGNFSANPIIIDKDYVKFGQRAYRIYSSSDATITIIPAIDEILRLQVQATGEINYNISDFIPNDQYTIYKDEVELAMVTANETGYIQFATSDTGIFILRIVGEETIIYAMMVNSSWNLISWPTPETIPATEIIIIFNNTIYTWQEACNNIIIAPFVYMYNGAQYVQTDYFYPYYGYWLYSHHDGVVLEWQI